MKNLIAITILSALQLSCSPSSPSAHAGAPSTKAPHLDLEVTSTEYAYLLQHRAAALEDEVLVQGPEDQALEQFLIYGKRNLDWIIFINQNRPADKKISMSSEATTTGATVNKPGTYNFQTINQDWEILKNLLPAPLKEVVFSGAAPTAEIPINERDFTAWLLQVDKAYQSAARYKMLKPYKAQYILAQQEDVRGYLFFRSKTNADAELGNWNSLSFGAKARYRVELVRICMNTNTYRETCSKELDQSEKANTLLAYKRKYWAKSESNYQSFFSIQGTRSDVTWTAANPQVMSIPFVDPKNEAVLDYLRTNIEEEWKLNGWNLRLNFVPEDLGDTTHVEFVPGSTPHVNGIAGSEITMDGNAPLTEYDVQWTIRHEYGHVLGFTDCYLEFYDDMYDIFVNYQLDVTDLMCSRRGHLKPYHFDELKRVYFKQ